MTHLTFLPMELTGHGCHSSTYREPAERAIGEVTIKKKSKPAISLLIIKTPSHKNKNEQERKNEKLRK